MASRLTAGKSVLEKSDLADARERVPLRLTASRGALGIELYQPVVLGPLEVTEYCWVLPNLRFPIDLSGGIPVFRHRRGELERVTLTSTQSGLSRWLAQRTRHLVSESPRAPTVALLSHGLAIGLLTTQGALAFDLLWAPRDHDARFVVSNARGIGLGGPALGVALRVVDSALGHWSERRGRVVTVPRTVALIGRSVLPGFGARAPSVERVKSGPWSVEGDRVEVEFDASFAPPATTEFVARVAGLAELTQPADDALAAGALDEARAAYLVALERAPRHPELARLIAEIDLHAGGRVEAALGLLVETLPAVEAGSVGAELLSAAGDAEAARVALGEAARAEWYAPLGALLWVRNAQLASSVRDRLDALDQATAQAPSLERPRWERVRARLEIGDVDGALADAQHLEAASQGARARHAILRRAGEGLLEHGFVRAAGRLFERALRYLPDDAEATYGLARALIDAGRGARAFALLERAAELGEKRGRIDSRVLVDLGQYYAQTLHDLPQAIARVREVPSGSERGIDARGLEARWRVQLGDLIGASQAFARLREAIAVSGDPQPEWVAWLLEAARFERDVQLDLLSAERHLGLAIRVAPRDRAAAEAYKEVAAVLAQRARLRRQEQLPAQAPATDAETEMIEDPEVEIGRLEEQLRANPDHFELVQRLAVMLERAGKDRELFALLSARLEEGTVAERAALFPRARAVLERLAAFATQEGHAAEAELYRLALERLE